VPPTFTLVVLEAGLEFTSLSIGKSVGIAMEISYSAPNVQASVGITGVRATQEESDTGTSNKKFQ